MIQEPKIWSTKESVCPYSSPRKEAFIPPLTIKSILFFSRLLSIKDQGKLLLGLSIKGYQLDDARRQAFNKGSFYENTRKTKINS